MKFRQGRYYSHSGGAMMHTLCKVQTDLYGETLVSERSDSTELFPTDMETEDATQGWTEVGESDWRIAIGRTE